MKIIHVITGLTTGGAERMLVKLIKSTKILGIDHSVISLLDKGKQGELLEELDININWLNIKNGIPSLSKLLRLRNIIDNVKPDVIQSWMYHANVAAYFANFLKKYPLIFNVRQSLHDYTNEKKSTKVAIFLNSILSSRIDSIIYNSETSKKQHEDFGYSDKISCVIPNGFDIDDFKPNKTYRQKIRNEFGVKGNEILIGAVGRNHPVKGYKLLIESFYKVSHNVNDVKFIIVGRGVADDKELQEISYSLGLKDLIIFENEREDLEKVWPAIDIYCSSSFSEAFSNTIGEAMLNEIPCVVTDVGDSAKILGKTGKIVPPENSDAIANAIVELCKLDQNEKKNLGQEARRRVIMKYSIENISKEYLEIYNRLKIKN